MMFWNGVVLEIPYLVTQVENKRLSYPSGVFVFDVLVDFSVNSQSSSLRVLR